MRLTNIGGRFVGSQRGEADRSLEVEEVPGPITSLGYG